LENHGRLALHQRVDPAHRVRSPEYPSWRASAYCDRSRYSP
jgi:hypothetical protein